MALPVQEKELFQYTVPLGGKRTHIGGGWLPSREEVARYEKLSGVDFEILSFRMFSIVNEARQAVLRVSGSPVVAEGGECLFAIYDAHGFTSSLATGLLLHTVGTQGNIREVLEVQYDAPGIYDGDIFMINEPSIGGYHACDQWTGTPVFYKRQLVAWLGSLTHTAETGAIEPGGQPASARSLLDEGYRVQGIKVQERGKLNRAAVNCLLRSTRDPAYYVLDLRARIAGLNVAKRRFMELIERYGIDKIKAAVQQNIDYAEELAKAKLRSLADGTWRTVVHLDTDIDKVKLQKFLLTMTKEGDTLTFDFDAPPPNEGWFNCHPPGAFGTVFVALASQLFWETPGNFGYLRPIKAYFPKGTCINIPYLTPCNMCTGIPLADAATAAIGKMLYTNPKYWGDINAPWKGPSSAGLYWGGVTQHGYPSGSLFSEAWASGTGAGIDEGRGDGCDTGAQQITVESCIADVEMMELQAPFLYIWRKEGMDSGGAGRWRGGTGVEYAVTAHNSPQALLGVLAIGLYGDIVQSLDGAYPSSKAGEGGVYRGLNLLGAFKGKKIPQNLLALRRLMEESGGTYEAMRHQSPPNLLKTDLDVSVSQFPGACGIGDPLDREPEKVLADMQNRYTSMEMAKRTYGVIIDPKTQTVNLQATERERERIKANRRKRGKIYGEGK